jgi:3',5'-cyclic AMP phosphodiesterase CpdA
VRILHLTDIHFGQGVLRSDMTTAEEAFLDDITFLCECDSTPVDLIALTGDVAFSGTGDQYSTADKFLTRLQDHFKTSQDTLPVVFAVPGNHDLLRPSPDALFTRTVLRDTDWMAARLDDACKGSDTDGYLDTVRQQFRGFTDWQESIANHAVQQKEGLLPGDSVARVETPDGAVCLVGLNTAFFDIHDSMIEKTMFLLPQQLERAYQAARDLGEAAAVVLLTHHPREWLNDSAKENLGRTIDGGLRVGLHMFGHLHTSSYTSVRKGGQSTPRQDLQGRSFMGCETLGDGSTERLMGYSLIDLDLASTGPSLRIAPREAYYDGDNALRFDKETGGEWALPVNSTWTDPWALKVPTARRFAGTVTPKIPRQADRHPTEQLVHAPADNNTAQYSVRLCAPEITVTSNPDTEIHLSNAEQQLLQVIALWPPEQLIPRPVLAQVPKSQNSSSVSTLLNKIGGALKVSRGRGIALDHNACNVDALRLESDLEQSLGRWDTYFTTGEGNFDEIYATLCSFDEIVKRSPVAGLNKVVKRLRQAAQDQGATVSRDDYDTLNSVVNHWQTLASSFFLALSDARLRTGSPYCKDAAIRSLHMLIRDNSHAENSDPDMVNRAWILLLEALHAKGDRGFDEEFSEYVEWCTDSGRPVDSSVRKLSPTPRRPAFNLASLPLEVRTILANSDALGMIPIPCDSPDATLGPEQCIAMNPTRLWFCGVLARKWVVDSRDQFETMLTRLDEAMEGPDRPPAQVRFLIMDPYGAKFNEQYRQSEDYWLDNGHIEDLIDMEYRHASFKVKVYDYDPQFRIHAIRSPSRDFVAFSEYVRDTGLRGPQKESKVKMRSTFMFEERAQQPMSSLIIRLFNQTSHFAVPLADVWRGRRGA